MRLDLFLSNTGIIKRRAIARQLCDAGKVRVNNNVSKPAKEIKVGDLLGINLSSGYRLIEVTGLPLKSIPKKEGDKFYLLKEFIPRERRRSSDF